MKRRIIQEVACLDCKRGDKPHFAKGLCEACYFRQYRKKNLLDKK